jgi:peptidyl-prolyl cis-trans isomerase SurA
MDKPMQSNPLIALRQFGFGLALALLALLAAPGRADAQLVAAIVNGDPITHFDVDQRSKLVQLSTQKHPSKKDVLEELIDERLKIQLLRRYNIDGIDKDVENALGNMARRMRSSPQAFLDQLNKQGVMPETLKSRIKAELIWGQIIRGRYQSSFQFSDKDIQARLEAKRPGETINSGFDYTLRPILFVVPRGSPPAAFDERRKEAEALKSRFPNCEQGIQVARGLRYVAVRPPVIKSSAELPPALRDILEKTEIGGLTAPEVTQQGVEIFALCGKRPSDAENAPAKREMRDEMYREQFDSHAKRFLKELRSQAMIEYR